MQGTIEPSPTRGRRPASRRGRAVMSPAPGPRSGEVDVAVAGLPEEVLLESELHEVGLGARDEHAVLAGWQHPVGKDQHAVVAGVEHAHGRDVTEGLVRL